MFIIVLEKLKTYLTEFLKIIFKLNFVFFYVNIIALVVTLCEKNVIKQQTIA
jgi:hypothetical protein